MGIDMMMYAERLIEGKWELCLPMKANDFNYRDENDEYLPAPQDVGIPRNKVFYAMLAATLENFEFESVATKRGWPNDVCDGLRAFAEAGEDWGYTWCFLSEIANFPWKEKFIEREGWVEPEVAKMFADPDQPPGVWPAEWVRAPMGPYPLAYYERYETDIATVKVRWRVSYWDDQYYEITDLLEYLNKFGHPDEVRVVMCFNC